MDKARVVSMPRVISFVQVDQSGSSDIHISARIGCCMLGRVTDVVSFRSVETEAGKV